MKSKKIFLIFFIIFIIFLVSLIFIFKTNKNEPENKKIEEKTLAEIDLLEEKIIIIMNRLNNINFFNSVLKQEYIENMNKEDDENNNLNEENKSSSNKQAEDSKSKSASKNNSENKKNTSSEENIKYEVKNNSILENKDKNVDWNIIKSNFENIYSVWPIVVIDLNSLNIDKDEILKFSSNLDQVALNIKNEDKIAALNNLAVLYSSLPYYKNKISSNKAYVNIDFCKSYILNGYALIEQNNWQEIQNQIINAINYYIAVMDNINIDIEKQNRINKVYIMLNELNNCIELKDEDIFIIKYSNVMEEIINI